MLNIVYLLKEVEMPEKIGLWHGKVITESMQLPLIYDSKITLSEKGIF